MNRSERLIDGSRFWGATYLWPPSAGLPVCRLPSDDLEFVLGLSEGREPEFCVDALPEGLFATGAELTVEEAMIRSALMSKETKLTPCGTWHDGEPQRIIGLVVTMRATHRLR